MCMHMSLHVSLHTAKMHSRFWLAYTHILKQDLVCTLAWLCIHACRDISAHFFAYTTITYTNAYTHINIPKEKATRDGAKGITA